MSEPYDQEPEELLSIEAVLETLSHARAALDKQGLDAAAEHVAAALAAIDKLR